MTGTNGSNGNGAKIGTDKVKQGLAQMLKGGVIVSLCFYFLVVLEIDGCILWCRIYVVYPVPFVDSFMRITRQRVMDSRLWICTSCALKVEPLSSLHIFDGDGPLASHHSWIDPILRSQ